MELQLQLRTAARGQPVPIIPEMKRAGGEEGGEEGEERERGKSGGQEKERRR